jgi:uncharacterized circularly permuted ATP-grasp superfamily protein/uncharacterized alpha-E superfamily protein
MQELLRGYSAPPGRFNEVLDPSGDLRPHWESFAQSAGFLGPDALASAQRRVAKQLHENGVTYNVQAERSPARAWALDVLPHIVPTAEWDRIASGLRQRARLLEAISRDIYGAQQLFTNGQIPPAVIFGHHGYLHSAHGVVPPTGTFLHLLAFDLGRHPDGDWRVLSTRTQAPSGAGYALENRLTVSRLFPDAFRDQHVQRLAPFFRSLQETLLAQAPADGSTPHIVLLTPGRYNETYFEHAYLSRYLGFTLVEGADLTVRDDRVFLKTVSGLRRVHAILRRMDDDFCDPLELRADSALGVPGLVHAWRKGNVLVSNAFGAGVIESPALAAFLPAICAALMGEPLTLRSTDAWWCGDTEVLPMAEQRLHELVVKPVVDAGTAGPVFGGILNDEERAEWRDRLRAWPERYVVEEYLPLAHSPVWQDDHLESRALLMRVFLAFDGNGDYRVLPGGLSRIGGTDGIVVSGQRGGGSKDTWVLSHAPVERFSLLPGRIQAPDVIRGERAVSSRSAEHLFWMGRYAERSENAARLLRAVLTRLPQGDTSVSTGSPPIVAACRRLDVLPADTDPAGLSAHDYERELIRGVTDADAQHSLAYNVRETLRVASTVRDRLSSDNWRILNQLSETLTERDSAPVSLADGLELLDHAIISLVAVGGLEMAHMTRDEGWRFMSLGRHLERVLYVIATTSEVAVSPMADDPALLEWLLDLSDSIITYRARYMGHAEWTAVADLLLFDRSNPRSAAFQLSKLAKHVPQLPGGELGDLGARLAHLAAAKDMLQQPDAITEYLSSTEQLVLHVSDVLTLRYFSHVYEPAHATLI